MALTIEVIGQDIVAATEWESFRYTEQIGQPDEMSVDAIGFTTNALFTQPVVDLFANPSNYFYVVAKLGSAILFSGLIRTIGTKKSDVGSMRYSLTAAGWQFLLPRRLVGVPDGYSWEIIEDSDPQRLPTSIANDPVADQGYLSPDPASVRMLFGRYWIHPVPIDLDTYVTDILGAEASGDALRFSGTDMEGALNDLTAAGSAAGMWWFANDSPNAGVIIAPHLALHWGLVTLPDQGEDIDDLLLGLPSAELPTNLAPYNLSDTPDGITSILPVSMEFTIDHSQRTDGVYVRGATGFVEDVLESPPGWPFPYVIGEVHVGGTGWVGSHGGLWGEEYLDAPAAVSREQRDAFGQAYLASRSLPAWTGIVIVSGVDGWHKGQAIQVTDADHGFVARWFLIRAVSMTATDPFAEDNEYTLTLGDVLSPSLGYALRQQRLAEQRKPIDPATQFVPYPPGSLLIHAGETTPLTMQVATAAGIEREVVGIGASWALIVNGLWLPDPFDTGALFWLSDVTTITDELGRVYATGNGSVGATDKDAATPVANVVLP